MSDHPPAQLTRRQFLTASSALGGLTVASPLMGAVAADRLAEITWMPGWQLRDAMAIGELSPVEVTEHFLRRIERLDPLLHAYITVDFEGAMDQARAAEQALQGGAEAGPLFGLPISIKDLYATKGLATTQGSQAFADVIPEVDEILVERLRNAGAIIIGKTQTPEFATFPRTKTAMAGECINPWNTAHITGASSGGSGAAVAAGISCFSVGSDGGGSTRIPSAYNGVFGLQPSAGRIPMRMPRSVHMASAGPMTLHVKDAALMIGVMAGADPRDPSAIEKPSPDFLSTLDHGIDRLKIAWSRDWGVVPEVDVRVIDAVENACKRFSEAGAEIDNPDLVLPDDKAWQVFLAVNEISYKRGGRLLELTGEQQARLSPPTRKMLEQVKASSPMTPAQIAAVFEIRRELQSWADGIFDRFDLICTPTLGLVAPPVPDEPWAQPYSAPYYASHISTSYTYIANVLGLPAASVPCGFLDGLPIGLQIIGPRFADVRIMRAAQAFATIQPWMDVHPALAL